MTEEIKYSLHIKHPYLGEANCREIAHDGDLYIFEDETGGFLVFRKLQNIEKERWLANSIKLFEEIIANDDLPYLPFPILVTDTHTGDVYADLQIHTRQLPVAETAKTEIIAIREKRKGLFYQEACIVDVLIDSYVAKAEQNYKN